MLQENSSETLTPACPADVAKAVVSINPTKQKHVSLQQLGPAVDEHAFLKNSSIGNSSCNIAHTCDRCYLLIVTLPF